MGAGSAKGLHEDDDADSISSEIKELPATEYYGKLHRKTHKGDVNSGTILETPQVHINNNESIKRELTASIPGPSSRQPFVDQQVELDDTPETNVKEESKKKVGGLFGFAKRGKEDEKTSVFVHEEDSDDRDTKKKEGQGSRFKLFYWRKEGSRKSEPKDERLEEDIKDLQRTFDSLGIVGKNWDGEKRLPSRSADDIRNLEPMRLRNSVRIKNPRSNGVFVPGGSLKGRNVGGDPLNSSMNGSGKRNFRYSWETAEEASADKTQNWQEFTQDAIEGFDPEKFKKLNQKEIFVSNTPSSTQLPHYVMDSSPSRSPSNSKSPPLSYDQKERELLASIEREYFAT